MSGAAGLVIRDLGLRGMIVEPGDAYQAAVARHESTLRFLDETDDRQNGLATRARLWASLAVNDMVLTEASLTAATSRDSVAYWHEDRLLLEWAVPSGYLERRSLSDQTAHLALENGGFAVHRRDLNALRTAWASLHGLPEANALRCLLDDCQAWWFERTSRPAFLHAMRLQPFQLLDRPSLARKVSGKPQAPAIGKRSAPAVDVTSYQMVRDRTGETASFKELVKFARSVASDKGSKDHGRRQVIGHINALLPLAAKEGHAQILVLAGVRQCLIDGGARGVLWAPSTTADYLLHMQGVVDTMAKAADATEGESWKAACIAQLDRLEGSARHKLSAFLQAFYRYLVVLAGVDPLTAPLPGSKDVVLPDAATVTRVELGRAMEYVESLAPTERVSLQARIILLLGFNVPLRTYEYWCIRLVDVRCGVGISLVVYPRRRDGSGKSASVRRIEDVEDAALRNLLLQMLRLRRADSGGDEDLLFGQPGFPDVRHEVDVTMALVNEGLRWATGDEGASVYDLRHACISRRAEELMSADHAH